MQRRCRARTQEHGEAVASSRHLEEGKRGSEAALQLHCRKHAAALECTAVQRPKKEKRGSTTREGVNATDVAREKQVHLQRGISSPKKRNGRMQTKVNKRMEENGK